MYIICGNKTDRKHKKRDKKYDLQRNFNGFPYSLTNRVRYQYGTCRFLITRGFDINIVFHYVCKTGTGWESIDNNGKLLRVEEIVNIPLARIEGGGRRRYWLTACNFSF